MISALRMPGGSRDNASADAGNAVLEFILLTMLLMIPLVYVVLAVFQVQGAAYAVTEATREAARAYVEADSTAHATAQACAAATIALHDQQQDFSCAEQLEIGCVEPAAGSPCDAGLQPGATIRAHITVQVALPLLPSSVFGHPTSVALQASHDEVVDAFRPQR